MAEEDIYKSKERYERSMQTLERLLVKPPPATGQRGKRKFYCRNPANLRHFKTLHRVFEAKDTSYIRRLKVHHILTFITWCTDSDLEGASRNDVDALVGRAHQVYRSVESKKDFLKIIKWLWRTLFPELDERGRPDERLTPYPVRHLSATVDRSKKTMRNDRLTAEEFVRIVGYFADDPKLQAYITVIFESLSRPQELCYRRIRDVELGEAHGRIWVSTHGKEGTKFLQCIDSYPYLLKWLEQHPHAADPEALLFPAAKSKDRPITPENINKKLKRACIDLGIEKQITGYSLKRNGVTFRRLRGDSDLEIQHVAGWTSTKQLQTYDLSNAEDSFREQLLRRGLIEGAAPQRGEQMQTKLCACGMRVGYADGICRRCKRSTERTSGAPEPRASRKKLGFPSGKLDGSVPGGRVAADAVALPNETGVMELFRPPSCAALETQDQPTGPSCEYFSRSRPGTAPHGPPGEDGTLARGQC